MEPHAAVHAISGNLHPAVGTAHRRADLLRGKLEEPHYWDFFLLRLKAP
jgi:hypothetical protein